MNYLPLTILGCLILKVYVIEGMASDKLKWALTAESGQVDSEDCSERMKRGLRDQLSNNVEKHKTHIQEALHGEETEEERKKRVNRSFERMLHFVGIVGQVDSYLSDRAKSIIKTLYKMVESEENNSY